MPSASGWAEHVHLAQALAPLRHKPFRIQFAAQTVSMMGTTLTPVAVAFGVLQSGGSATTLGIVLAANSIPLLIFLLIGGVWADRLPRHHLMLTTDLVRCVAQTTFGLLLITAHNPLWAMILLQALSGVAQAFRTPATIGLTAATAPAGFVQQANALIAVTGNLAGIAGPLIAGTLAITTGAGWALIIDGQTFIVSAWLMSRLRLPAPPRRPTNTLSQLREGWREVINRDWLWSSICWFAIFNMTYAIYVVLGPSILFQRPSGALIWGTIAAALSVGTLTGNMLALQLMPHHLFRWARVAELGVVAMLISLAVDASPPILIASAFIMGVVTSYPDALWATALQQEIPPESLSRVSSFDHLGSYTLRPVGQTIAATLIGAGTQESLIILAVAFTILNLASLAVPGTRHLTRTP